MKHIADAESDFKVTNINPDFCEVHGSVVPFEISQVLSSERDNYAETFHARGKKVLHVGTIIKGVRGNAGKGIHSGVSQGGGDSIMIEGTTNFRVQKQLVCRHGDRAHMNVKV